jgi:hypothetical protein
MTIYSGTINYPVRIQPGDRIEPGTSFGSSVEVRGCSAFTGFPEGASFGSSVAVSDCSAFTGFPEGTSFGSWVAVRGCSAFTGSPGCTLKGHPVAYGEEADRRVRDIAAIVLSEPRRLDMESWHDEHCKTVHCVAGHGVDQQGAEGYALERALGGVGDGTRLAGTILLGFEAAGHFYDSQATALEWLKSKLPAESAVNG